jgi:hypothetical protein
MDVTEQKPACEQSLILAQAVRKVAQWAQILPLFSSRGLESRHCLIP